MTVLLGILAAGEWVLILLLLRERRCLRATRDTWADLYFGCLARCIALERARRIRSSVAWQRLRRDFNRTLEVRSRARTRN